MTSPNRLVVIPEHFGGNEDDPCSGQSSRLLTRPLRLPCQLSMRLTRAHALHYEVHLQILLICGDHRVTYAAATTQPLASIRI